MVSLHLAADDVLGPCLPHDRDDRNARLLNDPASRAVFIQARDLRAASVVLMFGGVAAAGATTASMYATGERTYAPAGLTLLAVTGVGIVLGYFAGDAEQQATREYNEAARLRGHCN
jgi:hypothetical protein